MGVRFAADSEEDMLAVLLIELESAEFLDVVAFVPSLLESSAEERSKLGTARMVEFMRLGEREEEDVVAAAEGDGAGGAALPFTPFVFGAVDPAAVRDMAELIVASDAGVRVARNEGRGSSCCCLAALLLLLEGDCGGGNGYLVRLVGLGEVGGEVMAACAC